MLIDIFKINFIEKWLCLNIQKCPKKTFKDPLSDAFPMLLLSILDVCGSPGYISIFFKTTFSQMTFFWKGMMRPFL